LGERLLCKQEVVGSIPITSTMGTSTTGEASLRGRQAQQRCAERHYRCNGVAPRQLTMGVLAKQRTALQL
jgi:hypothetical protein